MKTASMNMDLDIDVQRACATDNTPQNSDFYLWVEAALNAAEYQPKEGLPTELTLRIVDIDESQQLNASYRAKDKPTNVLSFPFEHLDDIPLDLLGDLVICAPIVSAEAKTQEKTEHAHWAHMVIHGTLHLLGFDHIEPDEAETMEALEVHILQSLGFANPYVIDN